MKAHPRREFLLRVLTACGTPLVASVASMGANREPQIQPQPRRDMNSRAAVSYFGAGADAARAIGEAYLRRLEIEPTRASILEHTGGALQILAAARSQKAALTALASAVRLDFREGRVLQLEGWVLSRTEVELCALMLLPEST
jgi:hypothetical protein